MKKSRIPQGTIPERNTGHKLNLTLQPLETLFLTTPINPYRNFLYGLFHGFHVRRVTERSMAFRMPLASFLPPHTIYKILHRPPYWTAKTLLELFSIA